jgi:hypothetical protein
LKECTSAHPVLSTSASGFEHPVRVSIAVTLTELGSAERGRRERVWEPSAGSPEPRRC